MDLSPRKRARRQSDSYSQRRIFVLVYNVSHIDILFNVSDQDSAEKESTVRPRQTAAGEGRQQPKTQKNEVGREGMSGSEERRASQSGITATTAVPLPGYVARPKFSHFDEVCGDLDEGFKERLRSAGSTCFVKLPPTSVSTFQSLSAGVKLGITTRGNWDTVYVKNVEDKDRLEGLSRGRPFIHSVYFPLIAVTVPTWLREIEAIHPRTAPEPERIVYLVSGSGKPRNPKHSAKANSTKSAAAMIARFIQNNFVGVKVEQLDSGAGMFRFDENVNFVNNEVRPCLEKCRRQLSSDGREGWAEGFHVTLALSSGAPARVIAIQSALRTFKPTYLHMWQLKRFWHDFPSVNSLELGDVEVHSFEKIAMSPPLPLPECTSEVQMLTKHMLAHKAAFEAAIRCATFGRSELSSFWLRKTRKPVLSVLMVRAPSARGEIGLGDGEGQDPSTPIGSHVYAKEGGFLFYRGMNMEVSMPTGSLCAERNAISTALAANMTIKRADFVMLGVLSVHMPRICPTASSDEGPLPPPASVDGTVARPSSLNLASPISGPPSPAQRVKELNPLAPCGACKEWLLKISEVNPEFMVCTYVDSNCDQVYCNPVD